MDTVEEASYLCIPGLKAKSKLHCRVIENNSGAIEIATIS
jgi:hypothetical protein